MWNNIHLIIRFYNYNSTGLLIVPQGLNTTSVTPKTIPDITDSFGADDDIWLVKPDANGKISIAQP
jgi:hypothetical protein